jgi:hypothetical protein
MHTSMYGTSNKIELMYCFGSKIGLLSKVIIDPICGMSWLLQTNKMDAFYKRGWELIIEGYISDKQKLKPAEEMSKAKLD